MKKKAAIAVVGTFDSKAEEHLFLKTRIEKGGLEALTIHVGTKTESPVPVDLDLYDWMRKEDSTVLRSRDKAIGAMILEASARIKNLYRSGDIFGIISAGGGTGTHIGTRIMHASPGCPQGHDFNRSIPQHGQNCRYQRYYNDP